MLRAYSVSAVVKAEQALLKETRQAELMQVAAQGLADACLKYITHPYRCTVIALCGSGNNGGDALWACAKLAQAGIDTVALCIGERWHPEGSAAFLEAGGSLLLASDMAESDIAQLLLSATLIVDGIVGIGATGTLKPFIKQVIRHANASSAIKIAVDIPSGVNGTSGAVEDPSATFEADLTVTMGAIKRGLIVAPGRRYAGQIKLVDIGLNRHLEDPAACYTMEAQDIVSEFITPNAQSYKYSRGVAGIVAGSSSYRGAALLTTAGARSGGAGMTQFVCSDVSLATSVVEHFWDVVTMPELASATFKANALAIGPGIGTTSKEYALLQSALRLHIPVLVDADALTLMSESPQEWRKVLQERYRNSLTTVITPHTGEFKRLGFDLGARDSEDRVAAARRAAAELGAIVVLKGAGTIVAAPNGLCFIDSFGSACLSTAGTGDILSGLIASMLATHHVGHAPNLDHSTRVVAAAVSVHAIAGALTSAEEGFATAKSIAKKLPAAVLALRSQQSAAIDQLSLLRS